MFDIDGVRVAEYQVEPDLDVRLGVRPYLHPVRTLGGTVVTDELPEDHPWHLGASLAVQDVAGTNLWGGRTYVRDAGYTWREDHGRIVHVSWLDRGPTAAEHLLEWRDPAGAVLLIERRRLAVARLTADLPGWRLDIDSTLTVPGDRPVELGSPATNGRPGGAGYGGFFWRAAGPEPRVFTASADGEENVNGSTEPWVALVGQAPGGGSYGLVFHGLVPGDHWFVRSTMYPGVCAALAFERPCRITPGPGRSARYRVAVVDGGLGREEAARLAGTLAEQHIGDA